MSKRIDNIVNELTNCIPNIYDQFEFIKLDKEVEEK